MRLEMGERLTWGLAEKLRNQGEKDFALACLEVGCEVYYQIPIGDSKIDFYVVNPKANTGGKLVEVTMEKRTDLRKRYIQRGRGGQKKRVINATGLRKQRQMDNMKQSGYRWTMLFSEEVSNLRKR